MMTEEQGEKAPVQQRSEQEIKVEILEKLAEAAYSFYKLTLRGDLPSSFPVTFQDLQSPIPGDFVMESTTWRRRARDGSALGWLERITREPVYTDEEWREQGGGEPMPMEKVYYIKSLSGTIVRWTNCEFLVVANSEWLEKKTRAAYDAREARRGR